MRAPVLAAGVLLAVAVAGCAEDAPPPLPWERTAFPPAPVVDRAQADLGRLLFFDPILSADRRTACFTCHAPIWGMSDGLPLSIGVGGDGPVGTGRKGPTHTRRNARSSWNAALRNTLFWDGRATSLEDQIRGPLEDPAELGRAPEEVVADLRGIPEYAALFRDAFPDEAEPITVDTMARAIAAYERTFVSSNAPYDQYARGDAGALWGAAWDGMWLFADLGCASCHVPPLFEAERFDRVVLPAQPLLAGEPEDLGRFEVTGDPADVGRFRVPTLRNARFSGPYFHHGAVASLEEAVRLMAPRPLTDAEAAALVAFIEDGLTDESRRPHRPTAVPSGLPVPLDGFAVPR